LAFVEPAERSKRASELVTADALGPVPQLDDRRHRVEIFEPAPESLHLAADDFFGSLRLPLPLAAVLTDHALEIVDVVEVNVLQFVGPRIEVGEPAAGE